VTSTLLDWLRTTIDDWQPSIVGVFRERAEHSWPISADSPEELRKLLMDTGHLLPLPTEPASLANVMELELRETLVDAIAPIDGAEVTQGTERSYPDLEFHGEYFGGGWRAVDIKCARRKKTSKGIQSTSGLQSRIALYTGNTYFLWPQLKFSGALRPFGDYEELLSIVVIYDFLKESPERIGDVEVVVHETWRLASKARASATREYIGSVRKLDELRSGSGEFPTAEEFYSYWRASPRTWKKSPEAEKLLRQKLEATSNDGS